MSHRSSPTPFGPSRTRAVSPDLTDEDMHEAYPFDYFLAPRRPHACCMRCTNELQPFDFDDGDSSRETYINLPSPSANYRIILDIVGGVKRAPGTLEGCVALDQKHHETSCPRPRRVKTISSRIAGLAHVFARRLRPKRPAAH